MNEWMNERPEKTQLYTIKSKYNLITQRDFRVTFMVQNWNKVQLEIF